MVDDVDESQKSSKQEDQIEDTYNKNFSQTVSADFGRKQSKEESVIEAGGLKDNLANTISKMKLGEALL